MELTKAEKKNISWWLKTSIKILEENATNIKNGEVDNLDGLKELGEQLIEISENPQKLIDVMNEMMEEDLW